MVRITLEDEDYIVYKNIPHLCKSRNIKLIDYNKLSEEDFIRQNKIKGLFIIKGESESDKKIKYKYIFIPTNSNYRVKKKINELLTSADKYVLIFTDNKKVVIDDSSLDVELIDGLHVLCKDYPTYFQNAQLSYRVLNDDEKKQILWDINKIKNENLPIIEDSSMECIYSIAKIGDVLEITHPTYTSSGLTTTYRLVVPTREST